LFLIPYLQYGVNPETFKKAQVFTLEEALVSAKRVGYPVMLKASEGGGGKGIRMNQNEEELKSNFVQVQNEVPGSPMFIMQLCTNSRHLEVQIIGDEWGQAVALNGRDCSTQRRFQKIFEEGPPTIAKPHIFREMEKAAMRLTQSIGYSGAGTVEYLYKAATDEYYFLELNPRLQVEHPVTEGITGVNLPATQLQVAMGIPLNRMPQIRALYGRDPAGTDKIDFLEEEYQPLTKHVIAARITAENPDEGFKPTSGRIDRVKFQSSNNVWGYFSVGNNGGIHEFADSQFGHLFATGVNREVLSSLDLLLQKYKY
jgi:acetyl-CoA carboxylase/biotin carboxylase 1